MATRLLDSHGRRILDSQGRRIKHPGGSFDGCCYVQARDCTSNDLLDKWVKLSDLIAAGGAGVYCADEHKFYFDLADQSLCPGTIISLDDATKLDDCEDDCGVEYDCDCVHVIGNMRCCRSSIAYVTRDRKPTLAATTGHPLTDAIAAHYNGLPNYQLRKTTGCSWGWVSQPFEVNGQLVRILDNWIQVFAQVWDDLAEDWTGDIWLWEHYVSGPTYEDCCKVVYPDWADFTASGDPENQIEEITYDWNDNDCCWDGEACQKQPADCLGGCSEEDI